MFNSYQYVLPLEDIVRKNGGIEDFRIWIRFPVYGSNDWELTKCRIATDEEAEYLRKLSDGYKVTLIPQDEDGDKVIIDRLPLVGEYEVHPKSDFYISDIEADLRKGDAYIAQPKIVDRIDRVWLSPGAYIETRYKEIVRE